MAFGYLNEFDILKVTTLALLVVLLFSLGSLTRPTSLGAYLSFSAITLLQGIEMLVPFFSEKTRNPRRTPFPSTLEHSASARVG
jgi:hypothetical protein